VNRTTRVETATGREKRRHATWSEQKPTPVKKAEPEARPVQAVESVVVVVQPSRQPYGTRKMAKKFCSCSARVGVCALCCVHAYRAVESPASGARRGRTSSDSPQNHRVGVGQSSRRVRAPASKCQINARQNSGAAPDPPPRFCQNACRRRARTGIPTRNARSRRRSVAYIQRRRWR
jgi:hypothetical protein